MHLSVFGLFSAQFQFLISLDILSLDICSKRIWPSSLKCTSVSIISQSVYYKQGKPSERVCFIAAKNVLPEPEPPLPAPSTSCLQDAGSGGIPSALTPAPELKHYTTLKRPDTDKSDWGNTYESVLLSKMREGCFQVTTVGFLILTSDIAECLCNIFLFTAVLVGYESHGPLAMAALNCKYSGAIKIHQIRDL